MSVLKFVLFCDYQKSSRKAAQRAFALATVLIVALISTSCGTNAQANNMGQSLTLAGNLPGGAVRQSYNAVRSLNGGTNPYQFYVASGSLPPGLTLNPATGSFTGQPTTAGLYSFQVMVKDTPRSDQGTR